MQLPTPSRHTGVGFNMTPMIDVVFLLIIFFLVSSHMARQERSIQLPLPTASTGEDDVETGMHRITVNVKADGTLLLAGNTVTAGQLRERLRYENDDPNHPVRVSIRSDRTLPYGEVSPVLIAAAEAGIWDVSFSVTRKQEGH
ncbi:MAG: biopolymer transporter ExbD [Pirellulaceae bacterium]|nr:biopolymer transporter ExbD [Planctomycetales bacterium]